VAGENQKIIDKFASWLTGQSFNNILLMSILACIMWGGWFAMTTAIPAHLQQIQNGYESLTDSHREERERTQQLYDRWMNRTGSDRVHGSKVADVPAN
jgi:ABC-type thiamine transport system substrate-binding protein